MEPVSVHGRCVPWQIGTGNRRQICDFEVQPPPHDQMPRWVQEKPPRFQSTCQDSPLMLPNGMRLRQQTPPQQQMPCLQMPLGQSFQQQRGCPSEACARQQRQHQPELRQELRLQRFFDDEMRMSEFREMDGMERRFYVPPEFRAPNPSPPIQVKTVVDVLPRAPSDKRECRSMCMPKGMGDIDPNCQGEDYRINSGYQPSRPGDAVDRKFDPCCKWKPFRDGTSEGHKAAHWQFGKDREGKSGRDKNKDCDAQSCPENQTTIGNRSVYPKLGGMVPGYGGHVPGFERCKFGKTYGRETAETLKKVKSTEKIPRSYTMAQWQTKCYNKDINC